MRHFARFLSFALIALAMLPAVTWGAPILAGGGFETVPAISAGFPSGTGYWGGDYSLIIGASSASPFELTSMLQFVYTGTSYPSDFVTSDIIQLLDMQPYAAQISSGTVIATASAVFNRVDAGLDTDTQFDIWLRAYAGAPSSYPSQRGVSELLMAKSTLLSDSDSGTWEFLSVQLTLPANTDFVALYVDAAENVVNDLSGQEFAGHYVDDVRFFLPEPASMTVLGLGAVAILARRRRVR